MEALKLESRKQPTAYLLLNQHLFKVEKTNTIGSDDSCSIQLNVSGIEPRHARIEYNNRYIIKDMRSKKGVFVNDTKVLEAELQDGDLIKIGDLELIFSYKAIITEKKKTLKSKNHYWQSQLENLPAIASNNFPVVLIGESGSGKDVIARQIHKESERCDDAFVSVNCSALSPQLIESELFGHIKGAFTGADCDRKGAFMAASKGTLFLDEIGDLPLDLQPKLLRALENKEVKPVGSDLCKKTNVRIIAATHKPLHKLVEQGKFRQDLYYRLNVLQLNPPSLKDRLEDFEELFYSFAKEFRIRFDFEAINELKKYDWPGNIRELKNFIIKASVVYRGQSVTAKKVNDLFKANPIVAKNIMGIQGTVKLKNKSLLKQTELDLICNALIDQRGNQRKAAIALGMPTSTLNDRIKKFNIDINKIKNSQSGSLV